MNSTARCLTSWAEAPRINLRSLKSKSFKGVFSLLLAGSLAVCAACQEAASTAAARKNPEAPARSSVESPVLRRVIEDALEQTKLTVHYDPSYVKLKYPGGDVGIERGVCADVIIRAFRKGGVDLQKEIHEDMKRSFSLYPKRWGLTGPDSNIDHRRVANLMTYFERKEYAIAITSDPKDYQPGDVVAWRLANGLLHIGLVTSVSPGENRYMVHNIGAGARMEDVLFGWKIIGHYRCFR
jgi:uncharacterized protein